STFRTVTPPAILGIEDMLVPAVVCSGLDAVEQPTATTPTAPATPPFNRSRRVHRLDEFIISSATLPEQILPTPLHAVTRTLHERAGCLEPVPLEGRRAKAVAVGLYLDIGT